MPADAAATLPPVVIDDAMAAQLALLTQQAAAQVQALAAALQQIEATPPELEPAEKAPPELTPPELAPIEQAPAETTPAAIPDALAELMASPAFQAQMAALTQQAMAQLQALVTALRQAEGQLAPSAPPEDGPMGLAVEPPETRWIAPPNPIDKPSERWDMALLPPGTPPPDALPGEWMLLSRSAVMPPDGGVTAAELADDLLAVLPAAAPAPEPAALSALALSGPAPETPEFWLLPESHRAGAEGGSAA